MEYSAPKSMSAGAATNVEINYEMDEVLKRIQVLKLQYYQIMVFFI